MVSFPLRTTVLWLARYSRTGHEWAEPRIVWEELSSCVVVGLGLFLGLTSPSPHYLSGYFLFLTPITLAYSIN
jgi:hypothetical protein